MRRLNHIVLIHGASHGGYCWEDLAPLLRNMGYRVAAPDLPGLGADQTPIEQITLHSADGALDFDPSTAAAIFYNTCSPETVTRAVAQLRRQAHAPFKTPLHLTAARFGKVPKTYILCTQDQATPVAAQNRFCMRAPGMKKREMNTDHSPFYCDPQGLAAIIDEEARL